jgi:DNA-binding winged helix-turn-helix (wHTH) protein/tetratricopeptide (TPR) repeat protein
MVDMRETPIASAKVCGDGLGTNQDRLVDGSPGHSVTNRNTDLSEETRVIELAHEKPFLLGALRVQPAMRQLSLESGERETLEPRVMQVLVALARAGGEVLTRDDLTASCWGGRVVGEDAIDRVISRLRRTTEGIGRGAFRLETVTKVGYRLVVDSPPGAPDPPSATNRASQSVRRRALLIGGGSIAAAAIGGAVLMTRRRVVRPRLDRATQETFDQGWTALNNLVPDQIDQSVGLFRRVVAAKPDYADGWGALALAYAYANRAGESSRQRALEASARAAARQAQQLEPHNALAEAALLKLTPLFGNWLSEQQTLTTALRRHPNAVPLIQAADWLYASTGLLRAAAAMNDRAAKLEMPTPSASYRRVLALWSANRLEEAERIARSALETFPRSRPVWFTVFYFFMYTGRPEQALALGADVASRPLGVADSDFENVIASALAARSGDPSDVDRAVALNLQAAHEARGYAENAIQFAAFLGRPDVAFQVADAYYFGRGFQLGRRSFGKEAGQFYSDLRTYFLFLPSMAAVHTDSRFERLVSDLGLKTYWLKSGQTPDYLAGR